LTPLIEKIKNDHKAMTYLLLKDIFPQNAVDIGLISKNGLWHKYFRAKEVKLYDISDHIGCMSPANVKYLLKHNTRINPAKVEVNPNSIELSGDQISSEERIKIRDLYNIPQSTTIYIYGGNLGKPQGLDFLLQVLDANKHKTSAYFIIIGSGTEYNKIQSWFDKNKLNNAILLSGLPKEQYDKLVQAADIGLIFLDRRFTIPNYPSRLLSYLKYKKPVIAVTDPHTDIGKIAEKEGYGFSVLSGNISKMNEIIDMLDTDYSMQEKMGELGYEFLKNNYTSEHSYKIISKHF
jgi:glycosyltransferase involved in cell wall biosynthesis